jgi:hypothetical protein
LVGLELFPISFLGMRVGQEWIQNDVKYHDYDCVKYDCTGTSTRKFISGHFLVGYAFWFSSFAVRWDAWTQKHPEEGDIIDANSGLASQANGDTEIMLRGITGVNFDEEWSVVGGMQYFEMTRTRGFSRYWFAGPRWKQDSITLTVGGSYFSSSESPSGGGAFFSFNWTPFPSVGLH